MSSWPRRDWLWGSVLFLAVVLVYSPIWSAGYIWDDDAVVAGNPVIVGPLGLKEIWTTSAADICPLTLTTFWLEHKLWGITALPYHLVNVLMHGASAIIMGLLLRSLRIRGAWLGAALWALHPVQVESVAWIAELKNIQSGLFYLLSLLFFVRGLKTLPGKRKSVDWDYAVMLLFATAAIASKSSTVILPVVLCLTAWWIEGRLNWRSVVKIGPVFLMSLAAALLSMWTQDLARSGHAPDLRTGPERLASAGDAVCFYLGKLIWPHPLVMVYPRWEIDPEKMSSYLPLVAVALAVVLFWAKRRTWSRPWFFTATYYLVALLPILGFVSMKYFEQSFVADRFQYLASMGPLVLAGAGIASLQKSVLQPVLSVGLLCLYGILTFQQAQIDESDEPLWNHTLIWNPNSWAAHNGLGLFLLNQGKIDAAIVQLKAAVESKPNYAVAHNNLADAFLQNQQADEAIAETREALRLTPNYPMAYYNLGLALLQKGQVGEAITQTQKAVEMDLNYVPAHVSLGLALSRNGQLDEAIAQQKAALALDPNNAEAQNGLGIALAEKGDIAGALEHFNEAVRLKPGLVEAQQNLAHAQALLQQKASPK